MHLGVVSTGIFDPHLVSKAAPQPCTTVAGHCKRLAPAWGDLGQSLAKDDDVVVAHVDCTKAKTICSNAKVPVHCHSGCTGAPPHFPSVGLLAGSTALHFCGR